MEPVLGPVLSACGIFVSGTRDGSEGHKGMSPDLVLLLEAVTVPLGAARRGVKTRRTPFAARRGARSVFPRPVARGIRPARTGPVRGL